MHVQRSYDMCEGKIFELNYKLRLFMQPQLLLATVTMVTPECINIQTLNGWVKMTTYFTNRI